jgi:hypothetical protein
MTAGASIHRISHCHAATATHRALRATSPASPGVHAPSATHTPAGDVACARAVAVAVAVVQVSQAVRISADTWVFLSIKKNTQKKIHSTVCF